MSALLRLEGVAAFAAATTFYFSLGGGWLLFALLLLAPDVAMVGYLAGPHAGSVAYNAVHTYVLPLGLLAAGLLLEGHLYVLLALVWLAHIGMDRALGFGLKYPTAFKDTHLQHV